MDESVIVNNTDLVTKKKSKKKIIFTLIIVAVLIGIGIFSYFTFFTEEANAKRALNNYLSAMVNGKDTTDYKSIDVDDFINLLDYKYQRTILREQKDSLLTLDSDFYTDPAFDHQKNYATFDEFKEAQKIIFGTENVVDESNYFITFKSGKYAEYTFLYKVENTNALGQKLYNKYYFIVNNDNSDKKFEVVRMEEN